MKKYLLLILLFCSFLSFSQQEEVTLVSWNIRDFGKTKNSEELDQIAEIVSEADIVAIQEVVAGYGGAQAVAKLTNILNRKGSKWDYVISNPTNSPKYVTERYAFIWKTAHIKIKNRGYLLNKLDSAVDREPFLLTFYLNRKPFKLLNFHSRPHYKNPQQEIKAITHFIKEYIRGNVIFAGDFNVNAQDDVYNPLRINGFSSALINQKTTLKRECAGVDYLNYAIDNIFYSKTIKGIETGVIDFVRVCDQLENARKLSDHLPVYLKFSLID
tara:strand:- start:142 stop:954 length:813 start_codon:yes stop_codon:yes gene_type:complete